MDPSIPPANGSCYLLSIPREIRDHVYRFLFEDPLYYGYRTIDIAYSLYTSQKSAYHRADLDYNSLKYVCHQLRAETRGLGLKHTSELNFTRDNPCYPSAATQLLLFAQMCDPAKLRHIRVVNLVTIAGEDHRNYSGNPLKSQKWFPASLITFCHNNPHIRVNFHLPPVDIHSSRNDDSEKNRAATLVMQASLMFNMRQALRKQDIYRDFPWVADVWVPRHEYLAYVEKEWVQTLRGSKPLEWFDVPNIRYWPHDKRFSTSIFQNAMKRLPYFDDSCYSTMKEQHFADLVEMVNSWYGAGF